MICPKFNSYVHKLKMWGIEKRLCLLGECPTYTPTNWWWANWNSITHFSFCKVPSYVPPFEKEGSRGFSFWRTLQVRFVRRHFEEPLAWWYTKGAPLNKTQPCILPKVEFHQLFMVGDELEGGPVLWIWVPLYVGCSFHPTPPKQARSLNPHSALAKPSLLFF